MAYEYDYIGRVLPEHIEFITSQELEDLYPDLTPKQREYEIVKLHGAVFIEHIGGGIGQSRICMFFLRKAHIGEIQSSLWPDEVREEAKKAGIPLL